jgi:hypothetical protein
LIVSNQPLLMWCMVYAINSPCGYFFYFLMDSFFLFFCCLVYFFDYFFVFSHV